MLYIQLVTYRPHRTHLPSSRSNTRRLVSWDGPVFLRRPARFSRL